MQPEIIDEIRDWHRKRCAAMEIRKRADLALGSNLRSWLGWRRDLPPEESSRIKDLAADLIECGETEFKRRKIVSKNAFRPPSKKPLTIPEEHELAPSTEFKAFGDFILMSVAAREPTDAFEKLATDKLAELAIQLPVWKSFGESINGFGMRSLGVIVGEAGDLSNYATHSKLWKRMGMAVMDGLRQGQVEKGLSKDDRNARYKEHGYSPVRRSRMFVIGDTLIKAAGPYRQVYLARKEFEAAKARANGLTVAPAAKIPAKRKDEFMSEGHVHRRAQRYMEKRLLRDLWKAWRRADARMHDGAEPSLPDVEITDAAQAAGQAIPAVSETAANILPDHLLPDAPQGAGEARRGVSAGTIRDLPPQESRDAVQAADEAASPVSEKTRVILPRRKSPNRKAA